MYCFNPQHIRIHKLIEEAQELSPTRISVENREHSQEIRTRLRRPALGYQRTVLQFVTAIFQDPCDDRLVHCLPVRRPTADELGLGP